MQRKEFGNTIIEIKNLFKDSLRKPKSVNKVVDYPKSMRNIFYLFLMISAIVHLFNTCSVFLLEMVNEKIEKGKGRIAILFFLIYLGRDIIMGLLYVIRGEVIIKYDENNEKFLNTLVAKISQRVSGKIEKKVEKFSTTMEQEEIIKTLREYVGKLWELIRYWAENLIDVFSAVILVFGVIKGNKEIPASVLSIILGGLVIFQFMQLYFRMKVDNPIRKEQIKVGNEHENYKRDITHIPCLVRNDLETRIERYNRSFMLGFTLRTKSRRQYNQNNIVLKIVRFAISAVITLSKVYMYSEITFETITKITACLAVFNQATDQIERIMLNLSRQADKNKELIDREEVVKNILDEYNQEELVGKIEEKMVIEPFDLQYRESSQNDKPFRLILNQRLELHLGETVVLTGPSASGKSTLMKVATNRVRTSQQNYYVASNRYMFFDESTSLCTAVSLFEDLFNLYNIDVQREQLSKDELGKMQEILEHLNLWYEINRRSKDPWQWLAEHKYIECSNGQKQRLIIAKILYWLTPDIDVICLDEGTSGLDETASNENSAGANEVMQYIIHKCNEDRKRILFISTHQKSVEAMAERQLDFREDDDKNYIVEVKN